MQSDPLWSLAMAINVFLVFFFGANPSTFHKYQWAYCLLCYGLPALPAVTLLFVRTLERGHVYGDATVSSFCTSDSTMLTSLALVLDWPQLGFLADLDLLYSHLDLHSSVIPDLLCSWLLRVSST